MQLLTPLFALLSALVAIFTQAIAGEIYCPNPAGNFIGDVSVCHCYNNGFGIDRAYAIDAINAACRYSVSITMGPPGSVQAYTYTYPSIAVGSEGDLARILIKAECAGVVSWKKACGITSFVLESEECVHALMPLVDGCNTRGENVKQGGWGNDVCIEWTFDPGPQINNPSF